MLLKHGLELAVRILDLDEVLQKSLDPLETVRQALRLLAFNLLDDLGNLVTKLPHLFDFVLHCISQVIKVQRSLHSDHLHQILDQPLVHSMLWRALRSTSTNQLETRAPRVIRKLEIALRVSHMPL